MAAHIGLKAPLNSKQPSHFPHSTPHTHLNPNLTQPSSEPEPEPSMFGSSPPVSDAPKSTIKFLFSYGGKILPRYPDGKLRYIGGHTRVLVIERSIPFSQLLSKLEELCGSSVNQFRCQLPTEDLDALVSITSYEDLANLIEEYDRTASPSLSLKIRAFISPPRTSNKVSTPLSKSASSSSSSSVSSSSSTSSYYSLTGSGSSRRYTAPASAPVVRRCVHQMSPSTAYHVNVESSSERNIPSPHDGYYAQGNSNRIYLIHNGNHWQ